MKSKMYFFIIIIIAGIIVGIMLGAQEKNKIQVSESNDEEQDYLLEDSVGNINIAEDSNEIEKEYYLHDSNLKLPSDDECNKMHEKVIEGLTEKELLTVSKKIREIHMTMEFLLIDAVKNLKDPNSKYWILYIDNTPIIEDSGDGLIFSDEHCFKYVLDNIKNIENILKDKDAKQILSNLYIRFNKALTEHNIAECFEVHKTIHDFDFFMINHPVHFDKAPPADWEGINTYFGIKI